ncbi:MAG TPA: lytic transglycosylase domain-containing protein [Bacillota bacterium]|nr:lytic transglycosylase domain-containing protein [Bacillota bacterium]
MSRSRTKKKKLSFAVFILIGLIIITASLAAIFYPRYQLKLEKQKYPTAYYELVMKYSEEYSVPPEIIYGVIYTESHFSENAVSRVGAQGLMQLMPDTVTWLSTYYVDLDEGYDVFDPKVNIELGTFYLSYAYKRFGSWKTTYASYNAGIGRVDSWLTDGRYSDNGIDLKSIPINETSEYVVKVALAAEKYKNLYFSEEENNE